MDMQRCGRADCTFNFTTGMFIVRSTHRCSTCQTQYNKLASAARTEDEWTSYVVQAVRLTTDHDKVCVDCLRGRARPLNHEEFTSLVSEVATDTDYDLMEPLLVSDT